MARVIALFVITLLLPALAVGAGRSWRSDTKGRMRHAQVEAINRSIPGCDCLDRFDEAPVLMEAYEPFYPARLLAQGQGGECVLRFDVSPNGDVRNIAAVQGPSAVCAHSAIALAYWRFHPARLAGRTVATTLTMPFRYEVR